MNPFAALAEPIRSRPGDFIAAARAQKPTSTPKRDPAPENPWGLSLGEWETLWALTLVDGQVAVAAMLNVCVKTIECRMTSLKKKIGVGSMVRAVLLFDRFMRCKE